MSDNDCNYLIDSDFLNSPRSWCLLFPFTDFELEDTENNSKPRKTLGARRLMQTKSPNQSLLTSINYLFAKEICLHLLTRLPLPGAPAAREVKVVQRAVFFSVCRKWFWMEDHNNVEIFHIILSTDETFVFWTTCEVWFIFFVFIPSRIFLVFNTCLNSIFFLYGRIQFYSTSKVRHRVMTFVVML